LFVRAEEPFFSSQFWIPSGNTPSQGEEMLKRRLQQLLPHYTPINNYKHPDLLHSTGWNMELDVYYPDLQLAFEYHGQQHYRHMLQGAFLRQLRRDSEKHEACRKHNITLITIPFWWDGELSSLANTIHKYKPDVILTGFPIVQNSREREAIPDISPNIQRGIEAVNNDPAARFIPYAKYLDFIDPEATYVCSLFCCYKLYSFRVLAENLFSVRSAWNGNSFVLPKSCPPTPVV
jgi:hypothetical protein